jgi:hypothetical protein
LRTNGHLSISGQLPASNSFAQPPTQTRRAVRILCKGNPAPFLKHMANGVELIGIDTTINGCYNPLHWAAGKLTPETQQAVLRRFKRSTAAHRILVIHHTPWAERVDYEWLVKQNFVSPGPEEVTRWIQMSGATLLLCGHIHQSTPSSGGSSDLVGWCGVAPRGEHDEPGVHIYHSSTSWRTVAVGFAGMKYGKGR